MNLTDLRAVAAIEQGEAGGWTENQLSGHIAASSNWQYVWRDGQNGMIRAYICGSLVDYEAEIYRLVVARQYRRLGVGLQLLAGTLTRLFAGGAKRCLLEVRSENSAAVRLYEKTGFARKGKRKKYYCNPTDDAILMVLTEWKEGDGSEEH